MKYITYCCIFLLTATAYGQVPDHTTQENVRELVFEWKKGEDALKESPTEVQKAKDLAKLQTDLRNVMKDVRLVLRFPITNIKAGETASQLKKHPTGRPLYVVAVKPPLDILREGEDRAIWVGTVTIPLDRSTADDVRPGSILEVSGRAHVGPGGSLDVIVVLKDDAKSNSAEARANEAKHEHRVLSVQAPQFRVVKPNKRELEAMKSKDDK